VAEKATWVWSRLVLRLLDGENNLSFDVVPVFDWGIYDIV
jgi:hypothetical protein